MFLALMGRSLPGSGLGCAGSCFQVGIDWNPVHKFSLGPQRSETSLGSWLNLYQQTCYWHDSKEKKNSWFEVVCSIKILFYMYGCFFSLDVCVLCVPSTSRGQRRTLDLIELELWIVVSHCVGTGNQDWILCKGIKCSQPLGHLPILKKFLLKESMNIILSSRSEFEFPRLHGPQTSVGKLVWMSQIWQCAGVNMCLGSVNFSAV